MKSRRSSDRRRDPGPQPEFLIDRSLSQVLLPVVLRAADLIVHTLAEIYGETHAQAVEDTEWIALAAERDLVVFCKDDHIRRRPAERQALLDGNVRVFCLTNARLNFAGKPTTSSRIASGYSRPAKSPVRTSMASTKIASPDSGRTISDGLPGPTCLQQLVMCP
jgi:hypothetical protein